MRLNARLSCVCVCACRSLLERLAWQSSKTGFGRGLIMFAWFCEAMQPTATYLIPSRIWVCRASSLLPRQLKHSRCRCRYHITSVLSFEALSFEPLIMWLLFVCHPTQHTIPDKAWSMHRIIHTSSPSLRSLMFLDQNNRVSILHSSDLQERLALLRPLD